MPTGKTIGTHFVPTNYKNCSVDHCYEHCSDAVAPPIIAPPIIVLTITAPSIIGLIACVPQIFFSYIVIVFLVHFQFFKWTKTHLRVRSAKRVAQRDINVDLYYRAFGIQLSGHKKFRNITFVTQNTFEILNLSNIEPSIHRTIGTKNNRNIESSECRTIGIRSFGI